MVKYNLEKLGIEFKIARNGLICLEILEKESFDLIFMDMLMPKMDGLETTKYIRNTLKLNIPIIAMTAYSSETEKNKCIDLGMNDFISKPYK